MKYIKQLDSIRAIAVLLVIIHHWTPLKSSLHRYTSLFNGVDIFFVLSGFLITWILLENRNEADQLQSSKRTIIKNFFIRRVLRIFPIYYLLIFSLLLFAYTTGTTIKENFIYYFTYTANILFYNTQGWDGMVSHLWSLSVEEQFYLFWPWLMLFPRKSWLLPIILIAFITGVLAQILLPNAGLLTFSCLDCFGAGAFIAWAMVYNPKFLNSTKMLWTLLAVAAVGLKLMMEYGYNIPIPSRTLTSFLVIAIILYAVKSQGKNLLMDVILNNRILIFIGKISYGIYLYHLIIPYYSYEYLYYFNQLFPASIIKYQTYLIRLENFALVLALSYTSWRFIEFPILRLKKHFEYQKIAVSTVEKIAVPPVLEKAN